MLHPPPARNGDGGYSLVEVLLATGLLATVLLSVTSLFVIATQSVHSGRELTKAVTIANSTVEQAARWNHAKVFSVAGGLETETTKTWSTDQVNPSFTGTAEDIADWTATVDGLRELVEGQLKEGVLTYQVDGVGAYPTELSDGLVPFTDSSFLRVTVTVSWTEGRGRRREVTFEEIVL